MNRMEIEKFMMNAWTKTIFLLAAFTIYNACGTKSSVASVSSDVEHASDANAASTIETDQRDSFHLAMIDYHKTLSDSICGNGKTGGVGLCGLFYNNGGYYNCLKRKNYRMFKRVMKHLITNYKFDNTCYVDLLSEWDDVHDEDFFGMALELMKEDYEPDVEGFSGYAPVYDYIYAQIIIPNIKSVSGKPFMEFAKANEDCFGGYLRIYGEGHNIYCYDLLKPLWDAGKIELYGEEYFRNRKTSRRKTPYQRKR